MKKQSVHIKIRRLLGILAAAFCLLFCGFTPVYAQTTEEEEQTELLRELYEESGMDDAADTLSDETLILLYGLGIDPKDAETLLEMDLSKLPGEIWRMVCDRIKKPVAMLGGLIGVLLLALLLKGISSGEGNHLEGMVVCLGTAGIAGAELVALSRQLSSVFESTGSFVESFIPAYAGVLAASGEGVLTQGMQSMTFGCAVVITEIMQKILLPVLAVYLALCLVCAAGDFLRLDEVTGMISQSCGWTLGIMLSIFTLILSVQKMIAQASDTLGLKTAKFAMSTFVPVVGGPLSDALSSVTTCLQLLKASAGGFAVTALAVEFLPAVISLLLLSLCFKAAQIAAALLGVDAGKRLFSALSSGVSLLLGIVLAAAAAEVIAFTLLSATAAA